MATINAPQNLMKSLLQQRNAILEAEIERLRAELAECRNERDAIRNRLVSEIIDNDTTAERELRIARAEARVNEFLDAFRAARAALAKGER